MTAQSIIDAVKRYLRTENLPYTDGDLALYVGEVLGTLSETYDILTSTDIYNTFANKQSFTLPANFKSAVSVFYRPSALATVGSYNSTTKVITTPQNLYLQGWDEKGALVLERPTASETMRYQVIANNQIRLLDDPIALIPAAGDILRELKDWIELEPIDPPEGVLANPAPYGRRPLVETTDRGYAVMGRTLYIAYPITKTGANNLRVDCIVSHPVVGSPVDPVFIPPSWKEVVALTTAKRVLESWMGEEAADWIGLLTREIQTRLQAMGSVPTIVAHRGSSIRRLR